MDHQYIKTDEITDLWSFLKTIDWTESWLICLVVFHVAVTILTIITRKHHSIQGVLFFSFLLTVRCSEYINEYAATNWQRFSQQQYFDSNGFFISVVFSMPLLFNCLMMVINWLWMSSTMMVRVKRAELENQMKRQSSKKSQ